MLSATIYPWRARGGQNDWATVGASHCWAAHQSARHYTKRTCTGKKERLLTDLSSPRGQCQRCYQHKLWSLQYTSVDRAVNAAQLFGPSAILTKIDIKAAYHLIPDHLDDWPLLGLCWKECYYTLMGCCYSASGLHQKSTQQSWMRWSGVFTSGTNWQLLGWWFCHHSPVTL